MRLKIHKPAAGAAPTVQAPRDLLLRAAAELERGPDRPGIFALFAAVRRRKLAAGLRAVAGEGGKS